MADHRMVSSVQSPVGKMIGDHYVIVSEIGEGAFAKVYKGAQTKSNQTVAVKSVPRAKLDKKTFQSLESEISILKKFQHENIVQLIDCFKSKNHVHLIMEFCSLGDLAKYLKSRKEISELKGSAGGLEENIVRNFMSQFVSALKFMRSQNLIHRDIKPQNLLLQSPSAYYQAGISEVNHIYPILKVADFGFARSLPSQSMAETLCGSPLYMAPELLKYQKYDAKADLWSVGMVLYEMLIGKTPFKASNPMELLQKIEKQKDDIPFYNENQVDASQLISPEAKDLILSLLKIQPNHRISFEELFTHPFIIQNLSRHSSFLENQIPDSICTDFAHRLSLDDSPYPESFSTTDSRAVPQLSTGTSHRFSQSHFEHLYSPLCSEENSHTEDSFDRQSDHSQVPKIPISTKTTHSLVPETPKSSPSTLGSNPAPIAIARPRSYYQNEPYPIDNDYIVLEKKAIEMNYLADELAESPKRSSLSGLNIRSSRPPNVLSPTNVQYPPSRSRQSSISSNRPSRIARAISAASSRLFGSSPKSPTIAQNYYSNAPERSPKSANDEVIRVIEEISRKAHAIIQSAESQSQKSLLESGRLDQKFPEICLFDETLSYYLKALNYLRVGIDIAKDHWSASGETPRSFASEDPLVKQVQWLHDEYQECLVKAEKLKGRMDPEDSISIKGLLSLNYPQTFGSYHEPASKLYSLEEEGIVKTIEDLSHKAYAVSYVADMKYHPISSTVESDSSELTESMRNVCEELNLLYTKALAILQRSMNLVNEFWTGLNQMTNNQPIISLSLNNAVQWIRDKFNECLDKVEKVRQKLEFYSVAPFISSTPSLEKILYDQALEMSRNASMKETEGIELKSVEKLYQLSVWLLQAILERTEDNHILDEHDQVVVKNVISAINRRTDLLRRKMLHLQSA